MKTLQTIRMTHLALMTSLLAACGSTGPSASEPAAPVLVAQAPMPPAPSAVDPPVVAVADPAAPADTAEAPIAPAETPAANDPTPRTTGVTPAPSDECRQAPRRSCCRARTPRCMACVAEAHDELVAWLARCQPPEPAPAQP